MLVFTALLKDKVGHTSLVATDLQGTGVVPLAVCGVEAAQPSRLDRSTVSALQSGRMMFIPPPDVVHQIHTAAGVHMLQAYYFPHDNDESGCGLTSLLCNYTTSLVLLVSARDSRPHEVLNRLLIELRELDVSFSRWKLTICLDGNDAAPAVLGNRPEIITSLARTDMVTPQTFARSLMAPQSIATYMEKQPGLWNMARSAFAEVRLVNHARAEHADAGGSPDLLDAMASSDWRLHEVILPKVVTDAVMSGTLEALRNGDCGMHSDQLLMSTLYQQIRLFVDSDRRSQLLRAWGSLNREMAEGAQAEPTDWLLEYLKESDPKVRSTAAEVLSSQLPKNIQKLIELAAGGNAPAVDVIERAIRGGVGHYQKAIKALIVELGSGTTKRRQLAQRILANTIDQSRRYLVARMNKE